MMYTLRLFVLTLDKASKITSSFSSLLDESETFRWKVTIWASVERKVKIKMYFSIQTVNYITEVQKFM